LFIKISWYGTNVEKSLNFLATTVEKAPLVSNFCIHMLIDSIYYIHAILKILMSFLRTQEQKNKKYTNVQKIVQKKIFELNW